MKNEKSQLPNIIESILFLAGNAVAIKDISEKLELTDDEVKEAIETLKNSKSADSGVKVITFKDKAQLTTNADYAEDVAAVLNPIKEKALTRAALETIAIIAYKQPITRQEIEDIRGVTSDYAVQVLLTHNLIEVVGRKDAIGKPLMFGTTDEFLKRFELQSLEELPNYEDLLEQVKQISGLTPRDTIYNEFEVQSLDEEEDSAEEDEVSIEELESIGEKLKENLKETKKENKLDLDSTASRLEELEENQKAHAPKQQETKVDVHQENTLGKEDEETTSNIESDDEFADEDDEFDDDDDEFNDDEFEEDEEEMDAADKFLNSGF